MSGNHRITSVALNEDAIQRLDDAITDARDSVRVGEPHEELAEYLFRRYDDPVIVTRALVVADVPLHSVQQILIANGVSAGVAAVLIAHALEDRSVYDGPQERALRDLRQLARAGSR
jgi:hypothetical protein